MTAEDPFYTVTMAEVHARQGNLAEARRIYQHLLAEDPEREDLIQALKDLEAGEVNAGTEELLPLFREWLDLIFRYNKMKKLNKLKRFGEGK
jgi:hypothetical protein